MIFNLGNWLLKLQAPGGDTSIFLLQAVKWVTGAAGLALLVLGAHVFLTADPGRLESGDSSERQTAILYMSLGVGCVVAFLIWYIRDARADRRDAKRIAERWASVKDPPS